MSFRYTNSVVGAMKYRLLLESTHREMLSKYYASKARLAAAAAATVSAAAAGDSASSANQTTTTNNNNNNNNNSVSSHEDSLFSGTCDGIRVVCSPHGRVQSIQLIDKDKWAAFYAAPSLHVNLTEQTPAPAAGTDTSAAATGETSGNNNNNNNNNAGIDLAKVSRSVRAALWEANEKIARAKEEGHHQALQRLRGEHGFLFDSANSNRGAPGGGGGAGALALWYMEDRHSLLPRPRDGLFADLAPAGLQRVRYGTGDVSGHYNDGSSEGNNHGMSLANNNTNSNNSNNRTSLNGILTPEDALPHNIPIGAVHHLYTPALFIYERGASSSTSSNNTNSNNSSQRRGRLSRYYHNHPTAVREYKKEMSRDEQLFWDRVEAIRKSQNHAINGSARKNNNNNSDAAAHMVDGKINKRGYADMADSIIAEDASQEKVELRFIS